MDFNFTDQQLSFKKAIYKLSKNEIAPLCEEADLKAEFSREIWQVMSANGLLGLPFPKRYGGQEANVLTCTLAGEALGQGGVDQGHILAMGAHTYLCTDTIFRNGTGAQHQRYLKRLISGEWIGCMALTEPESGSDAGSLKTLAVKKGDCWILNGTKTLITNAPIADVFVVFATVDPSKRHEGITGFILERNFKGLSTGKPFDKMGVRTAQVSEINLNDCEVADENRLGPVGTGYAIVSKALEWDRSVLLAPFVGGLQLNLEQCAQYASKRFKFGKPIGQFPAIQEKIAEMKTTLEIARLAVYRVAAKKDAGQFNPLEAAIAKAFVGDWGMKVASEAVQIFGGVGYLHQNPVERFFRDMKLGQIGGGTSEIQRLIISKTILTQNNIENNLGLSEISSLLSKIADIQKSEEATTNLNHIKKAMTSLEIAFKCIKESRSHILNKKAMGATLNDKQWAAFKFADMIIRMDLARMLILNACWAMEKMDPHASVLVACAKLFALETVVQISNLTLQVFGNDGCFNSSVANLISDAKLYDSFKGSSELKKFIVNEILTQN